MRNPEKLFGIIGYPLGHSMSPGLHNWAFDHTGYPGVYLSWQTPPEKLDDFFAAARALGIGGNITIPHKVACLKYMDEVSAQASAIGAINTFYWREGKLCGENTDITGFMAPIKGGKFRHALILGAGGVSRAVAVALKEMNVPQITITNRTATRAQALAKEFDLETIDWEDRLLPDADLVVNATSMGMKGEQASLTPYEAQGFVGRKGLVYDIVYNPLETRLLREARAAGWETVNGLAMFVEQARAAFRLWTGGLEMPREGAFRRVRELLGL